MIRSARAFFLSRALREKLLLVVFIAIAAMWWASSFSARASTFWQRQRTTNLRLTEQAEWIKNQAIIEETAKKTASRLDPTKTLNGNQLVTNIGQLAAEADLKNMQTSGSTVTTTSGQFAVHSQEFVIRNVEWETLSRFYEALQRRSPYVSLERFTLISAPNNPAQLTLNLKVTSVEITR
jgi:DNA gyrase inhibitor GyrI